MDKLFFSSRMHQSKQLCLHQEMKSDKNKTFQHKKMNSKNKNFRIKKQETEIGKFCVSIKCYCFVYKKKMSKFSHNLGQNNDLNLMYSKTFSKYKSKQKS